MSVIGYARVSTGRQDAAGQVEQLEAAGCGQVFTDKASGAEGRRRPQLKRALAALEAGDTLIVAGLDRLGRSTYEIWQTLASIGERGARFRSLRETWADTTTPEGRFMVTMFAGMAELERSLILSRTGEGRQRARARGVRLGRPPRLTPEQAEFARDPRRSLAELARILNVSRATIVRARSAPGRKARKAEAVRQVDLEDVIAAMGGKADAT
jgi:DNA invertase Pin-like site-specific DNA recombinase